MSRIFEAVVNLNGVTTKVTVSADNTITATRMLEAQYGKNNIRSGVYRVD